MTAFLGPSNAHDPGVAVCQPRYSFLSCRPGFSHFCAPIAAAAPLLTHHRESRRGEGEDKPATFLDSDVVAVVATAASKTVRQTKQTLKTRAAVHQGLWRCASREQPRSPNAETAH